MKRKSISSFVLGLLSGLIILGFGYFTFAPLILVLAFTVDSVVSTAVILSAILYAVCGLSFIIGASLCFRHAKAGGLLLLISAILSFIFPILFTYVFMKNLNSIIVVMYFIPCVLSLIAGILGIKSKAIETNIVKEINE